MTQLPRPYQWKSKEVMFPTEVTGFWTPLRSSSCTTNSWRLESSPVSHMNLLLTHSRQNSQVAPSRLDKATDSREQKPSPEPISICQVGAAQADSSCATGTFNQCRRHHHHRARAGETDAPVGLAGKALSTYRSHSTSLAKAGQLPNVDSYPGINVFIPVQPFWCGKEDTGYGTRHPHLTRGVVPVQVFW